MIVTRKLEETSIFYETVVNRLELTLDRFLVATEDPHRVQVRAVEDFAMAAEKISAEWLTLERVLSSTLAVVPEEGRWNSLLHALLPARLRRRWVKYREIKADISECLVHPPEVNGTGFVYRFRTMKEC